MAAALAAASAGARADFQAAFQAASLAAAQAAAPAASMAAAGASNELQGAAVMQANGQSFFFLPLFGFADPEAVMAADREQLSRAV